MNSVSRLTLRAAVAAVALGSLASSSRADGVGTVFVIAMENHNFTQPSTFTSIQQLQGNTAAPYLNSLITPGNSNAAMTSYATNYTNAGQGVHPSEPNYIWAEAATNYNAATNTIITTDADPSVAAKNIFDPNQTQHLTALMNQQHVSWTNYQEDYQVSGNGPLKSSSGNYPGGATNPYYGSTQYNYAVKHNPMAFFSDTATQNVAPLGQLATDLANNTVAKYNWISPNQYNDMHSSLNTNFTYNGVTYTHNTDQQAIAIGDNFLSQIVPQIEASQAFKNNGAIVIWNDETEGGDGPGFTSTEIVISPLAVGNAFSSNVAMNHSSDIKTMQEIFNVGPFIDNSIPLTEPGADGSYNTVAGSNDLGSLFQAGTIPSAVPEPGSLAVIALGSVGLLSRRRRKA
ncbi:MAG: phosphoesterase [Phycisphaerales bacterium]|nr:phosphoesterase [Phycisphaerales bacterium]